MKTFLTLLTLTLVVHIAHSLTCYTSNRQSRKPNDNGEEYECREAAGATQRYCLKIRFDKRPGRVFRECDRVYEQLFEEEGTFDVPGYAFEVGGEPGCKPFAGKIQGRDETGVVCKCLGDRCNSGDIKDSDINVP